MRRSKVMLPFGGEAMGVRVVRRVAAAVDPVVVVAAPGQALPDFPPGVVVLRDRAPDRGPLEGLAVGLKAVADRAEAAFATACDVPLLVPGFVRRMVELAADCEIAVPRVDGFDQPLSGVYRVALLPRIETLLSAGRLRPAFLFDQVATRRVGREELIDVDPQLQSLANVNSPAEYRAALAAAGLDESNDLSA